MGLILTACSSPEEQKIEKETGFKISKIKDAYQIKKEMKNMEDNVRPTNLKEYKTLQEKFNKLQEKAKEYEPIYEALDDFLDVDPITYGKVLGKDKEWERAMYVSLKKNLEEFIKSDPQIKEMLRDIKDFLNNLSKDKSEEYQESARKEYSSKLENLKERYSEVVKIFKEQHKDIKYILDKINTSNVSLMYLFFDIPDSLWKYL